MSMRGFAKLLHVSATSVHRWEHEESGPDPYRATTLLRIRTLLDNVRENGQASAFVNRLTASSERGVAPMLDFLFG